LRQALKQDIPLRKDITSPKAPAIPELEKRYQEKMVNARWELQMKAGITL
jgi:hypothetical protein